MVHAQYVVIELPCQPDSLIFCAAQVNARSSVQFRLFPVCGVAGLDSNCMADDATPSAGTINLGRVGLRPVGSLWAKEHSQE